MARPFWMCARAVTQNAATRQALIQAVGLDFGAMTGH